MGCDIHMHAEKRREDGTYEAVDISVRKRINDYEYDAELLGNRNYALFGWLADVRNYSDMEPLSPPRGVPDDASAEVAKDYEDWAGDAHSASWFSVDELLAQDFGRPAEDRRVTRQVGPNFFDGGCTAEPGGGRVLPLRDIIGHNVEDELREIKARGADRIVFWFDN